MKTNPNTTPRRIIHLDLVDVAHMNLLDYFDRDQWDSSESTAAGEFIDLIGERILSVSETDQRDPLEVLQAAENALAMIRAAITGEEVSEMQRQQIPAPRRHIPAPAETLAETLAQIRGTPTR